MMMPVLTTKLFIPARRTNRVIRPKLIERLNRGLGRKMTLISASAGFGKTTLVSEWVGGCDRPAAWLSLDEGDQEFPRFMTHLAAALQRMDGSIGIEVTSSFNSTSPLPAEMLLTTLLNEISALQYTFILILDDYHTIHAKPIDEALVFLLEHLPPQMHMVMITRENPQLPLGRIRAQGQLNELRDADLRFSSHEAAEFLNQVMGLSLSAKEIAALESRTEGWIAGLQLAALSMQGNEDIPGFIQSFTGNNRYIVDYLAEEVLQRQPESVRDFLLQTSILDRLNGPLCDAVTGGKEGSVQLEFLEKSNFFVVPLDANRHWYRYHHLFAEVLFSHLQMYQPERMAVLHKRASAWYEQHGSTADSITHALAAEDFTRAAELVEQSWPEMRRSRQGTAVLGWLKALPEETIRCRPVLNAAFAWALLAGGEITAVEGRLKCAEQWLDNPQSEKSVSTGSMIVIDEEEFRLLPGTIAGYRSALAQVTGNIPDAIQYARQVLDLVPEDDHLRRGAASALLGLASWSSGDLAQAYQMFYEGMVNVEKAGNIPDAIGGTIALADIRISQGRLNQAMSVYERGLQIAAKYEQGTQALRGEADINAGLSELYRERNDLDTAFQHLQSSKELRGRMGFPRNPYRWQVSFARLKVSQGDLSGALGLLQEAENLYVADFFPNVRPVSALKAKVLIALGRVEEALEWVREHGLSVKDDLSYLREFEHITLARTLLAHYKRSRQEVLILDALALLDRLLKEAEQGGRMGSSLEILNLQAMAQHMLGNVHGALTLLELALQLAEPEGYARIFLDEGEDMIFLLQAAAAKGIAQHYVHKLLPPPSNSDRPLIDHQFMSEVLSERELEVLRLLTTEWSGPDIARSLHVSLNTLRTHTKNIYSKLEVNNRRAAVRRAQELDLFQ